MLVSCKSQPAICLPFETMAEDAIQPMTAPSGKNGAPAMAAAISDDRTMEELTLISFDRNPLDPSLDSLRAAMGQLDYAAPYLSGRRSTACATAHPTTEALKEHAPGDLGRIVLLDRMLEVKPLRRKFTRLASTKKSREFGLVLARRRVAEKGRTLGSLYVDGHVRPITGNPENRVSTCKM